MCGLLNTEASRILVDHDDFEQRLQMRNSDFVQEDRRQVTEVESHPHSVLARNVRQVHRIPEAGPPQWRQARLGNSEDEWSPE